MTDNEIIKALECCLTNKCDECAIYKQCHAENGKGRVQVVLDLIKCQKAEIEKYRHIEQTVKDFWIKLKKLSAFKNLQEPTLTELLEYIDYANSEAIKEFAERLKEKGHIPNEKWNTTREKAVYESDIDNLVKEMTEITNENNSN